MNTWNLEKKYLDPQIDDLSEVTSFLEEFGLHYEQDIEKTVVIKNGDQIIGTGSIANKVLKCIAVDSFFQGEGILNQIVESLKELIYEKGMNKCFVYTSKDNVKQFENLGFNLVAAVGSYPALLEESSGGIETFREDLKQQVISKAAKKLGSEVDLASLEVAGLVMNCNPITNGHLHLINTAARENDLVIVFVLTEERSLFPAQVRFELVEKATKDLDNVVVIKDGDYILSYSTFPTYFLGPDKEDKKNELYARLDAKVFGEYIINTLKIDRRYVGKEPYSPTTEAYNRALKEIMPDYGVELIEIERKKHQGKAISASTVREYIREDNWGGIKSLVPDPTYDFITSMEADDIVTKIKTTRSRH